MRAYGLSTQANFPEPVLRLLELLAAGPPIGPRLNFLEFQKRYSLRRSYMYEGIDKYSECTRDEV